VRRAVAVLAALGALVWAGEAFACACCGEPGTWYEETSPLGALERDALSRLRFTTARPVPGPEEVMRPVPIKATLTRTTWRWQLGPSTTLTFHLPRVIRTLVADIHDGKRSGGGGPLLYRELRLEGSLTATGALRGTRYRLVLQGRGNNCLNAGDFRAWHLDVAGGARYSLYGTFR
jgi:hypothetical protein